MQRIRVTHIINSFEHGGAEAMLCRLLERTDRDHFEPTVVSLIDDLTVAEPVRRAGIPLEVIGLKPGAPDPRALWRLARHLRRLRADVVQTWMDHSNLIGGLASRMVSDAPVVWGVHHSEHVAGLTKRTTLLAVRACAALSGRVPARIVCCSEHSRRLYAELGFERDRMVMIPNGFDTDVFAPDAQARAQVRAELGMGAGVPLIGLVARYHPLKDHSNFLRAAAELGRRLPAARFVLCGHQVDADNEALAAEIRELGLGGRCYLLGARSDVARICAALDVATSSSVSEAFPLALGEAMSCGVPCVATDVGDSARIVGDTGLIVPPRDAPALAAGWVQILNMDAPARRELGVRARQRVCDLFDLRGVTRRYEALYESLAAGKGLPRIGVNGHGRHKSNGHSVNSNGNGGARPLVRVLMVVESAAGGTGRHVLDLCEGLLARGCEVHLIYSAGRVDQTFVDRLPCVRGIRAQQVSMRTVIHPSDLGVVRAVRSYVRANGPFDVLHGHSSKGGAVARLAAVGTATPAFYTLHGLILVDPGLAKWKRMVYRAIEMGLSLQTERIIAVSPEEQRAARRMGLGDGKVVLVPNGIGRAELTPRERVRAELGLASDAVAIGFVGRLVDQKAPAVLLGAFAMAVRQDSRLRLVIVGSGPLEDDMRVFAEQEGIASRILWLGEREARGILAGLDVFALSSRKEGLPYVVLEAMAAELPIVATASSGVESLVEPGVNGMIVERDDAGAMGRAFAQLAGDEGRRREYGRASGRKSAEFTIDRMVDRTIEFYNSARVGRSRASVN